MHQTFDWKSILLGLCVAYIVSDVLLGILAQRKHPSLILRVLADMDNENVLMAGIIGLLVGVLVWWMAREQTQHYTPIEQE